MSGPTTIGSPLPQVAAASAPAKSAGDAEPHQETAETKESPSDLLVDAVRDLRPPSTSRSRLSIDHDAFVKAFVYRSIDKQTGEVIQQWPGEDALKLRRYMRQLAGLVVDEFA